MPDDLAKFPDSGSTITYLNEKTGLIEVRDVVTGRLLAVQRSPDDLFADKQDQLIPMEIDGQLVMVEKGIDVAGVRPNPMKFSWTLASLICQKIMEGKTYTSICKEPGMPPYSMLIRWRKEHPDFQDMIDEAKSDRADWLAGEALEIMDDVEERPDAINKARAQAEVRKWLASKDAPSRFGNKVELTGKQPVQFILETGIRRDGDEGFLVDETKKIKDIQKGEQNEESESENSDGVGGTT